jgi:hypothetical protein
MAGLVLVVLALAGPLLFLGYSTSAPTLVALGLLPLVALAVARVRLRVVVRPERLVYRGFFATSEVALLTINSAGWASAGGYISSRIFGPFVYEFRADGKVLRINLKLFSRQCAEHLLRLVPPHLRDSV